MKLKDVVNEKKSWIKEAKKEIDIHREYEPGEFFWSPFEKGMLFKHGETPAANLKRRKWGLGLPTHIQMILLIEHNSY